MLLRTLARAGLITMIAAGPAPALEPVDARAYAPMFDAVVVWMVDDLQIGLACAPRHGETTVVQSWLAARDMLMATLARGGMDSARIKEMSDRLDSASLVAAQGLDCGDDPRVAEVPEDGDWAAAIRSMLESLGLPVVARPATAGQLGAIRDVFAEEVRAQARLLQCLASIEPRFFVVFAADWDEMLAETTAAMIAAGVPPDAAEELRSTSVSTAIWQPGAESGSTDFKRACRNDDAMIRRVSLLDTGRVRSETRRILGITP